MTLWLLSLNETESALRTWSAALSPSALMLRSLSEQS